MTKQLEAGGRLKVEKNCYYCGGDCPIQPEDSGHLCDGFAGDIDGLYKNQ